MREIKKKKRAAEARGDWANSVMSAVVGRDLPPTAHKILLAAQRVLARDGYEGLSLRRVAEEALETQSLVLYHFGRRANLEALLVDSLWHDVDAGFVQSAAKLPTDAETRIDALIAFYAGIADDIRLWRIYYDLLPSVIGDSDVRRNLAHIYQSYRRDINAHCLQVTGIADREVEGLSSLFLAVGEGLPLQKLLNPSAFDLPGAFGFFGALTRSYALLGRTPKPPSFIPVERAPHMVSWRGRIDPCSELPKPAQRILKAGRRLVEKRGLKALTLDAIAKASKQPRSSVSYYFQGKQGLIDAIFESVLHSHQTAYTNLFSNKPVPEAAELQKAMFARKSPIRALFLMLPAVLHDEELRTRAGIYYGGLRDWLAGCLGEPDGPTHNANALAEVIIACIDGVSIQALYDPTDFDPAYALASISALIAVGLRPNRPVNRRNQSLDRTS